MSYRNPTTRFVTKVQFSQGEIDFLESIKPWSPEKWSKSFGTPAQNQARNTIKGKIKTDLETIQNNYCAFCGIDLQKVYKVHREHIAPQYRHPYYIFEPENLVLACIHCNDFKGKKRTVITDTQNYTSTTFNILHPYRDDYNQYLECDFQNRELIFSIIGPEPEKTLNTIKCVGLDEPHLMTIRGAVILHDALPITPNEDNLVKEIVSKTRRGN